MKKIKVECLECRKQYFAENKGMRTKTFTDIRIIPINFINKYYNNVNDFIESENGTIFEADYYNIIKSNEYDKKYNKYIYN